MKHLPIKVQEGIYFKAVVSSMTYCISIWGTSSSVITDAVDTLHSRAAKLIYNIKEVNLRNVQLMSKVKR